MHSGNKGSADDKSRRRRRVTTAIVLVCVLALIDIALCLVLEPFGAHSEVVWTDYRATKDIDTVIIGSSYAAYDLDPRVLDAKLGASSYNMATPGQSVHDMLTTLDSVSKEHELKRVVLCLGYETIAAYPHINSSVAFTQAKCMGESPLEALADVRELLFDEYYFDKLLSISCAFPWGYDHVDYTPEAIANNIQNRLRGDVHAAAAQYAEVVGEDWQYESQGYGATYRSLTGQNQNGQPFVNFPDTPFYQGNVDAYSRICELCDQRGIPLYVVVAPHTFSAIHSFGSLYQTSMPQLEQIAKKNHASYMDLNLLHRGVYDPDLSYYSDYLHLSNIGAEKTTTVLADLIGQIEGGESVDNQFYSYDQEGWSAYQSSIGFVDSVACASEVTPNGLLLTASAVTGTDGSVAYKFEVYDTAAQEWRVVRDYDTDPCYTLENNGEESVKIRVYAQSTNGQQDAPRWLEDTVSMR